MYLVPEKAIFKLPAAAEQTAECTIRSHQGSLCTVVLPCPFNHPPDAM
jgi:hypothetical protein